VAAVDEALALKRRWPDALVMGEVHGRRVDGFDFGNSTSAIARADLAGRRLIQRTSAGTQGVLAARDAGPLLLGNFVGAGAIVRYVQRQAPTEVSLVALPFVSVRPWNRHPCVGVPSAFVGVIYTAANFEPGSSVSRIITPALAQTLVF